MGKFVTISELLRKLPSLSLSLDLCNRVSVGTFCFDDISSLL